jgi:enoyl-CoA hydratase
MTPELSVHGHLATITLRRPRQANRLQPQDLAVIAGHIAQVNAQAEVLVLRFESSGKYFCSGFDINQIGASHTVAFDELVNAVEDARPVTIAAIQGGVYGGATDLALACDFRIGTTDVDMFMPAARLGLHFYQRGLERYVSRLGLDTAKRLFLTAEKIDAVEMKTCGFLTHLVDADALLATADNLSNTLAAMAPIALLGMKKHLNTIGRGVLDVSALNADMARAAASSDIKEGAAAWAEKREPKFSGR